MQALISRNELVTQVDANQDKPIVEQSKMMDSENFNFNGGVFHSFFDHNQEQQDQNFTDIELTTDLRIVYNNYGPKLQHLTLRTLTHTT